MLLLLLLLLLLNCINLKNIIFILFFFANLLELVDKKIRNKLLNKYKIIQKYFRYIYAKVKLKQQTTKEILKVFMFD
jgi:hypothetical protein